MTVDRLRCAAAAALVALAGVGTVPAEGPAEKVRDGNRRFEAGDLDGALERYTEAQVDLPDSPVLHYNIGNVLYRRGEYEQAIQEYRQAALSEDRELSRDARFNIGNAHFQAGEFDRAVEEYQEVLQRDPADADAKRNLELALRALQEPPPDDQQKDQKKDQKDKEQQEQKEQSQGQGSPPDQDGEQPSEQGGEPPPPQEPGKEPPEEQGGGGEQPGEQSPEQAEAPQPQPGPQEPTLPEQEAARILDALKQQEKDNMKRALRAPVAKGTGKDW